MKQLTRVLERCPLPQRRRMSDYAPEIILKKDNMLRAVSKFQAMPQIRMQTHDPPRRAAVLIPLCVVDNKVSLLFTLRAANMRSHKGQVSFPGGMQDQKDKSLLFTALRETREELGIVEKDVTVWGSGNPIVARSETSVLPVVGTLDQKLDVRNLRINPAEVEEVFTVPLEVLCQGDKLGYTQFRAGYSTPLYFGGKRKIWGLTAIITNAFLKCLLQPPCYTHKIKYLEPVKTTTKSVLKTTSK